MASDDFDLIIGIDFGTTGSGMRPRPFFFLFPGIPRSISDFLQPIDEDF